MALRPVALTDTSRTRPREPLALDRGDSPPPTTPRDLVAGDLLRRHESLLARPHRIDPVLDPSAASPLAPAPLRQLTTTPGPDAAAPRPSIILDTVHETAVLDQIATGARHAVSLSRVTISLRPPDLGSIQIAVESRAASGPAASGAAGHLSAHFHATQPAVHAWLQSNASVLRFHLSDAGLHFQDLTFSTAAHHQFGHSTGDQPNHGDFLPPPPPTVVPRPSSHDHAAHGRAAYGRAVGWFA